MTKHSFRKRFRGWRYMAVALALAGVVGIVGQTAVPNEVPELLPGLIVLEIVMGILLWMFLDKRWEEPGDSTGTEVNTDG